MPDLSQQQQDKRRALRKGALIWGILLGLIVAAIAWWMLGARPPLLRATAALALGTGVAAVMYFKSMAAGAAASKCAKCGAAYSLVKTDSQETLVSAEPREKREQQDDGVTKITTWIEETCDVVDTYTCSACGNVTQKEYQTTRRRDEETLEQRLADKARPAKAAGARPQKTRPDKAAKRGSDNSGQKSKPKS